MDTKLVLTKSNGEQVDLSSLVAKREISSAEGTARGVNNPSTGNSAELAEQFANAMRNFRPSAGLMNNNRVSVPFDFIAPVNPQGDRMAYDIVFDNTGGGAPVKFIIGDASGQIAKANGIEIYAFGATGANADGSQLLANLISDGLAELNGIDAGSTLAEVGGAIEAFYTLLNTDFTGKVYPYAKVDGTHNSFSELFLSQIAGKNPLVLRSLVVTASDAGYYNSGKIKAFAYNPDGTVRIERKINFSLDKNSGQYDAKIQDSQTFGWTLDALSGLLVEVPAGMKITLSTQLEKIAQVYGMTDL